MSTVQQLIDCHGPGTLSHWFALRKTPNTELLASRRHEYKSHTPADRLIAPWTASPIHF
jgi:hypothetical protein